MKTGKRMLIKLLAVLMFVLTLAPSKVVLADGGSDISSTNVTGLTVSSDSIDDGGKVRVDLTFDDTYGEIRNGDTITVSWYSSGEVNIKGYVNRFPLEIAGQIVGEMEITEEKAVITFNEKIENLEEVSGSAYFEVQGRNLAETSEEDIRNTMIWSGTKSAEISIRKPPSGTSGRFYYKTGDMLTNDTGRVRWFLNINNAKSYVDDRIFIEDKIQDGQRLDPNSFKISGEDYYGRYSIDGQGDAAIRSFCEKYPGSSITYSVEENSITVVIPQDYASLNFISIGYKTEITNPDQKYFDNNTLAWYQENGKEAVVAEPFDYRVWNINSGGNITGTVRGELKIVKVLKDSKIPIEGVAFSVEREDGGVIREDLTKLELTTDEQGIAGVKGLPAGKYMVKEVSAPDWVAFNPLESETLLFEVKNSDVEGTVLNIENNIRTISIPVKKKWVGEVGEKAEIKLFANDAEISDVVLNKNNNWEYTFMDLPKYNQITKEKIIYTISEVPVNGYHTVVTGSSDTGFVVTNTPLSDLLISKTVTGEAGDKIKAFTFEIRISDAEGNPLNGVYDCVGGIKNGYEQEAEKPLGSTITFENGKAEMTLSHGQQIVIKKLPLNCSYTVMEKEANQDCYLTTYNDKPDIATGILDRDKEIHVVNNKEFIPDTGIADRNCGAIAVGMVISAMVLLLLIGGHILSKRKGVRR